MIERAYAVIAVVMLVGAVAYVVGLLHAMETQGWFK